LGDDPRSKRVLQAIASESGLAQNETQDENKTHQFTNSAEVAGHGEGAGSAPLTP
jgi:hypothetical protein